MMEVWWIGRGEQWQQIEGIKTWALALLLPNQQGLERAAVPKHNLAQPLAQVFPPTHPLQDSAA